MQPVPIDVDLLPGAASPYVRIRPAATLGPSAFRALAAALANQTVMIAGSKVATVDKLPEIIASLRAAKIGETRSPAFDVRVDPAVIGASHRTSARAWIDAQGVDDRIRAIGLLSGGRFKPYPFQETGIRWLAPRIGGLLADDQGCGKTLETIAAMPFGVPALIVCPSSVKGAWRGQFNQWRPHVPVAVLHGKKAFRWPEPGEVLAINFDVLPDVHDRTGEFTGRKCDGFLDPLTCRGCKRVKLDQRGTAAEVTLPGQHELSCSGTREGTPPFCPGCHPLVKKAAPGTIVIVDEAHYAKNDKAIRTRGLTALARGAREGGGKTWLLTGTPMENSPRELWTVLEIAGLGTEAFGSFPQFLKLFKAEPNASGYGMTYHPPDPDTMKEKLSGVMLRRLKIDVLRELPDKTRQTVIVDVRRDALAACEDVIKKYGDVETIVRLLERDAFPLEVWSAARAALATAKIPALIEFLDDWEIDRKGEPIIVFGHHVGPLRKVAARPGWALISGDENGEKRTAIVEAFQKCACGHSFENHSKVKNFGKAASPNGCSECDCTAWKIGKLKGLAVSIRAGGAGITLTAASTAVFVERDLTSTKNAQAEDRLHRIGAKKCCNYVTFAANHPLDIRIAEILSDKREMIEATVDAAKADPWSPDSDAAWFKKKHKLDDAINDGARRGPTEAEAATLATLPACRWETPGAGKVAEELVYEAGLLGLTDGGWALAQELYLARIRSDEDPAAPVREDHPAVKARSENAATSTTSTTSTNNQMPERPKAARSKGDDMGDSSNKTNVRRIGGGRDKREKKGVPGVILRGVESALNDVTEAFENVTTAEDRVELVQVIYGALDELEEQFCLRCGQDPPHGEDEICPAAEDEDEDEDEEDEEGDE